MRIGFFAWIGLIFSATSVLGQQTTQVVDLPTRPGVTQRILVLDPPAPKAVVLLFAGGNGGLQIGRLGNITALGGNFLVRTRAQWADQALVTLVVDAPSDRQSEPYLGEFRQTPAHVSDVLAIIEWARNKYKLPVWLIGTSRGTESIAYVATNSDGLNGPDGLILTSTIVGAKGRSVTEMQLDKLRIPVLVVSHERDGCQHSAYAQMPELIAKLVSSARKELIAFTGGSTRGDVCQAYAHHGFNGIEGEVIASIAGWILRK